MSGIGGLTVVALLNSGCYFINGCENINEFLIAYVEYIGIIDRKVFKILADSNKMSIEELIKYINDNVFSYDDKILEIYEVGKKIY